MADNLAVEVTVRLSLPGSDDEELNEQSLLLKNELNELRSVQSIEPVPGGSSPDGSKSGELNIVGEWVVKLGVVAIPGLFDLLKNHQERAHTRFPTKIKVKTGRHREAEIEYDPSQMTPQQVDNLVKQLSQTLRGK